MATSVIDLLKVPLEANAGAQMHAWMRELWGLPRSLTGQGTRDTLTFLSTLIPGLTIHSVPSGTTVGDWIVPNEWNIRDAYIETEDGRRLLSFRDSNLHVVGYSTPIDAWMSRAELDEHLHYLPDMPSAIPYITSYYEQRWGFCLSYEAYRALGTGPFHVVIDSTLEPGHLNFADVLIPGETSDEVFLTSYVCHPSMANNELSGPVVLTALARWIAQLPRRHYSYRVYFGPETIGAITYLHLHAHVLRDRVRAGWVVTCVGDDRTYSYLPSRRGDTLCDRISLAALRSLDLPFHEYTYRERGSDERQWCWPTVDLPMCSLMRSKYGTYPEYHTSLDDLDFVTPRGLMGSLSLLASAVAILENCVRPVSTTLGEPQLGSRGLYPTLGTRHAVPPAQDLLDLLSLSDGSMDLLQIAEALDMPFATAFSMFNRLEDLGLVVKTDGERLRSKPSSTA